MFNNYLSADITACMAELLQKWVSNNLGGDVAKTARMEEMLHKAGFSK